MDYREEKIGGDGHVAIHDWEPVDQDGHLKNTSEIESDINETRHTMDVIFDTLTDRLRPGSIVDQLVNKYQLPQNRKKIQDALINGGKRISEAFQRDPFPLLFIGVGVAWLIMEQQRAAAPLSRERVRNEFPQSAEDIIEKRDAAQGNFNKTKESVSSAAQQAKERISAGSETIRDTLLAGGEKGSRSFQSGIDQGGAQASQKYYKATNAVSDLIRDKPLVVGIAAAMVGMAAGILFPESNVERQTAGPSARDAFRQVKEKGEDVLQRAKTAAKETAENVSKNEEKAVAPEASPKKKDEREAGAQPAIARERNTEKQNEVEQALKTNVSPGVENVEINLKEKSDVKSAQKDKPFNKPHS